MCYNRVTKIRKWGDTMQKYIMVKATEEYRDEVRKMRENRVIGPRQRTQDPPGHLN